MGGKLEIQQGTLVVMVLRTLQVLEPLHGYGIARRIEETSRHELALNYGTLYPALLKLEQEGYVTGEWRTSENNRRARYYALTTVGRKRLVRETEQWSRTSAVMARFLHPDAERA
ncbi:MAG: PadR family transcriptional regulator [Gemmatimonadaceae bacterium]